MVLEIHRSMSEFGRNCNTITNSALEGEVPEASLDNMMTQH